MSGRICTIGSHVVTGFSSQDTSVSIEYNEDQVSQDVGASGDVVYSISANKSATLTLSLQQTSPTNDYLEKIASQTLGMDTANNFGAVPLSIRDITAGSALYAADECVIQKVAKEDFGKKVTTREWKLFISKLRVTNSDGNTIS